jgi:hypothetical protein
MTMQAQIKHSRQQGHVVRRCGDRRSGVLEKSLHKMVYLLTSS